MKILHISRIMDIWITIANTAHPQMIIGMAITTIIHKIIWIILDDFNLMEKIKEKELEMIFMQSLVYIFTQLL